MFDVEINGISLLALIPGVVEAIKQFFPDLDERAKVGILLLTGFVLFGVYTADVQGLIPPAVMEWVGSAIYALAATLSVGGYYALIKRVGAALKS